MSGLSPPVPAALAPPPLLRSVDHPVPLPGIGWSVRGICCQERTLTGGLELGQRLVRVIHGQ